MKRKMFEQPVILAIRVPEKPKGRIKKYCYVDRSYRSVKVGSILRTKRSNSNENTNIFTKITQTQGLDVFLTILVTLGTPMIFELNSSPTINNKQKAI